MNRSTIKSFDDFPIAVHEFIPTKAIQKTIVFAAAVGVPQKFYFDMAIYLAKKGYNVFTFDYRGVGYSRPKKLHVLKNHGFLSWAKDFKAVSKNVKKKYPTNLQFMIGHSFGGNSVGLSDAYQYYDNYITIASQFAFYKNFSLKIRLLTKLNFKFFVPITTFLFGYYPAHWFGLGESLSKKAANDWAAFLFNPDSMLHFTKEQTKTYYQDMTAPMLLVSIEDDTFAPQKSVDILAKRVYYNADVAQKHLKPSDYNLKTIGHFDFFRTKNQNILWHIITEWFEQK